MPPSTYSQAENIEERQRNEGSKPATNSSDLDGKTFLEDSDQLKKQNQGLPAALGSICWLNMIPSEEGEDEEKKSSEEQAENSERNNNKNQPIANMKSSTFDPDSENCCMRGFFKFVGVIKWILNDFTLRHLVWIKLIFLFQSASMTVLYPYLNLHMKSLGVSVQEVAIINAMVPILFIFTPPLAGFLADRLGNFRVLLSILTALGGLVALLLLIIPAGRDMSPYPDNLNWGISCGKPNNRARFQKLMLHGFKRDECEVSSTLGIVNLSFTPGTCGYLCPTRSKVRSKPRFFEFKVIWPNRGGGFGISEIVDEVSLDTEEARMYHEPDVVDNNIFFPMNWTFHLSCDRIRPNDCIFNPIKRAPSRSIYNMQVQDFSKEGRSLKSNGPTFNVESITPPETGRAVNVPVNCGSKEIIAQVVSTQEADALGTKDRSSEVEKELVDTRFSGCTLHCLVNIPRDQLCNNTETGVTHDPSITFWCYLLVRTALGVLTAASLMMFEGAVMATIQELGGDYGIQRFVGNFGAIVFAPLGGWLIDVNSGVKPDFSSAIYIYLVLKLTAAIMILFIHLDFRPPGERILQNIREVLGNLEVVVFLIQMMFAGTFWGFIEGFLFWWLDDLNASKFLMGWTVAIGMITSLPFLIFSGPITDLVGHINVIIVGMIAYFIRLIGYSFLVNPIFVYPYEALEGFTMALMMTSAVTYVAKISGPQTIASVMGIMGALFFGIGKGSGALIGGIIMSYQGAPFTFRFFGINALICAVVYLFFQFLYVRPKNQRKLKQRNRTNSKQEGGEVDIGNVNKAYSVEDIQKDNSDVERGPSHHEASPKNPTSGPRSLTGGTMV